MIFAEPALIMATVLPDAVATAVLALENVMGNPDVDVALTVKAASPNVLAASVLNVMV